MLQFQLLEHHYRFRTKVQHIGESLLEGLRLDSRLNAEGMKILNADLSIGYLFEIAQELIFRHVVNKR